jgi:tetratricopeptide (TPR) repeat protein
VAYRRALAAAAPADDHVRRLRKTATVEQKVGRYDEALGLCREALALVDDPADLGAAAVEAFAALTCCYAGEPSEGLAWAELAAARLVRSEASGAERWVVEAALHRARGNLLLSLGRANDAATEYQRGLAPCDALDDRWERSIALYNIGEAFVVAGDLGSALRYLEQARKEKSRIGDRWGLGYTWLALARLYREHGDHARASECAHTAGTFMHAGGDPALVARLEAERQYAPPTQNRIV